MHVLEPIFFVLDEGERCSNRALDLRLAKVGSIRENEARVVVNKRRECFPRLQGKRLFVRAEKRFVIHRRGNGVDES